MVLSPPSSRLLNSRRPCDGLEPIRYHVPGPICHVSWKHHQVGRLDLVHQKQSYKIHWKKWPLSNVWGCEIWCFWRKKWISATEQFFPKFLHYEWVFWVDKFEITTMFSNKTVVDSYNLLFCKFATAKQTLKTLFKIDQNVDVMVLVNKKMTLKLLWTLTKPTSATKCFHAKPSRKENNSGKMQQIPLQ